MPNTGTFPISSRAACAVAPTWVGSPGPFEKNTPSGAAPSCPSASTRLAGVSHGTTTVSHPTAASPFAMPRFSPQSYATTRKRRFPAAGTTYSCLVETSGT